MAFQGAKSYYSILHISQYTLKKCWVVSTIVWVKLKVKLMMLLN